MLDCRVENEGTNWRQGTTGYTVIDGFGACAHRGEGADVGGEYFMMTWWSRCIGHYFLRRVVTLEGFRTAKRPTWIEAWGDLGNCDTETEPSPPFAPVMRTVPFELAMVDVVWYSL